MKRLVAGGGFELQSRIHSGQVIDSATREKGTIGINSDSFLHFSYTFSRQPRAALAFFRPTHETTLPHHRKCDALRSVRGQRLPFRSAELPAEIGDEVHQQSESTWRWQPRFELLKLLGQGTARCGRARHSSGIAEVARVSRGDVRGHQRMIIVKVSGRMRTVRSEQE